MSVILAVAFGALAAVCGAGWFLTKVSFYSVVMHLVKKGYTAPTDEEMSENAKEVIRRMFGLKLRT